MLIQARIESASGKSLASRINRLQRDYCKMVADSPDNAPVLIESFRAALNRIVEHSACAIRVGDKMFVK